MILLTILLAPLAGTLGILLLQGNDTFGARRLAAIASGTSLVLALWMLTQYSGPGSLDHLTVRTTWVAQLGISFHLAVDGLSMVMVLLNAVVLFSGCLVSYQIQDRAKEFYVFLLVLGAGVFGVFMSQDLFWFYLSYELAVVPMFVLIGVWGSANRERAAMTLNLYLTCGALLALVGLLLVYFEMWRVTGHPSFNLTDILAYLQKNPDTFSPERQIFIFPLLLFGFASLSPMWPMHTWSPMGHAAAPSAASMMHAGVLMKLGSFAIVKVAIPLMPEGAKAWMPVVAVLACFNIIWGGLVAMAQADMKFMIGYSSSSHMGYVLLGLAALNQTAMTGACFLLFAHGVMTALAFSTIGFFYDQTHTRRFEDLGGMAKQIPFVATCFAIMAMASAGLPGFANFASELLVLMGTWSATDGAGGYPLRVHTILGLWGIVIGSVYLLRAVRDAFLGPANPRWDGLKDAEGFQRVPFVFMILVLLITGCYPPLLTGPIQDGLVPILARLL